MAEFVVWCPDPLDHEGPEEGRTISAMDARDAAVCWARWWDHFSADYPIANGEEYRLCVRDADDDVTTWDIQARTEVEYLPYEATDG